jgi:hypothetical protein
MEATQVPEIIGGTIPHETVVEAMREDGFLPSGWVDCTPPPAHRRVRGDLGSGDYIAIENYDDLPDRLYVCGHFAGVTFSVTALTGDFEEAKRMAPELLREKVKQVVAVVDRLPKTEDSR